MIVFDHVSKSFRDQPVLQNICWRLREGECWQIRGVSGIGKTTLLRLLMGLETPDAGSILRQDTVQFCPVFQEDRLIEHWNAIQNVCLVCDNAARAQTVLSKLLPEQSLAQPVCTLSGGMRRRVALARALCAQGDILVLDEPFTGLDEQTACRALAVLKQYRAERAVVLVSHGSEAILPDWKLLRLDGISAIL